MPHDVNGTQIIWLAVPCLAFLIMGIVIGVYIEAKTIERTLNRENVTVCEDADGKLWIEEQIKVPLINNSRAEP